jgi:hypothetical protein
MTEDEWLQTANLYTRVRFVASRSSDRKLRLFACASARRCFGVLEAPHLQAIEVAEQFADGLVSDQQRAAAYAAARHGAPYTTIADAAQATLLWGAFQAAMRAPHFGFWSAQVYDRSPVRAEAEAVLLRVLDCVFGNPFRKPVARPFPVHVAGLARSIYAAFPAVSEDYLILADALEELGEADAAAHCRTDLHAKGCHIVDWIMARS